jgi:hypothetical protein
MADLDPIEVELNWNSKEFMDEFNKFLAGGKDADEALDKLKNKFSQISKEQQTAAKGSQDFNQNIREIGQTVNSVSASFDSFGLDKENLQIQKQVIKEIENQIKELYKTIDKMAPGTAQAALITEVRALENELSQERDALKEVEAAYNSNRNAAQQLSTEYETQLARLKELALARQTSSEEYQQLLQSVQEYRESLRGLNEDLDNTSRNSFGAFLGVLTLMSSGLSVAQGVMGLFADENENLERIMLRVQSLMAITIALQEINTTLNDRNAASTRALIAVQNLYVAANTRVSASLVALGLSATAANIASKALLATLTLGLTVAIAAVMVWFEKYQAEQEEMKEAQKKHAEAVADSAAEQMIAYKKLQITWNGLAGDMKSKQKFINGNQDAFKKLGVEVTSVSDAENVLVRNTNAFVESMMARAEAAAAMQLATEKFKEYLVKFAEENEKLENPTIGQNIGQWWQMGVLGKSTEEYIGQVHEDSEKAKKEYEKFIADAVDFEKRKDEIYKKYGFRENLGREKKPKKPKKEKELAEVFDDKSLMKLQQQIMLLDGALQRMGKNGEVRLRAIDKYGKQHATKEVVSFKAAMDQRAALMQEYAERERKIRYRNLQETISENEESWKAYYQYEREFGTKAAKEQFSALRAEGASFYDWLGYKRDELSNITAEGGTLTAEQKEALELITKKRSELTGERTEFELFSDKTEQQLKELPTLAEQIDYLVKQRDKLTNDYVDKGFYSFLDLQIDEKRNELRSMVSEYIGYHQNFEIQKTNITEHYSQLRKEIEERNDIPDDKRSYLLQELQREQNEELAIVTTAQYQRKQLEDELSANLLNITTNQLKSRLQTLKEFLNTEVSLTKAQREKLTSEVLKIESVINTNEVNRDEKILLDRKAKLLKDINGLKSKGNALTVVENNLIISLLEALGFVNEKLRDINLEKYQKIADWSSEIAGSFAEMAEAIDDSNSALTQTLQTISELGKDVSSVIGAFQKGIVEGIVSLVASVIKWVGKLFTMGKRARESERQAQEEMRKYQEEIFQSQLDYNAELRKRIADEAKLNDLYKSRVDNIKEEMEVNKKNTAQILKDQQEVFNRLLKAETVAGMHTEKYGGFLGMGRKTRIVEELKTVAELLGIGSYSSAPGVWGAGGIQIFQPGQVELTDELFDKLEKINGNNPFTGAAKTAFEQLKKLRDEYGSIAELNKQLEIELKNTLSGTTAQALADSIREGLKSGKKTFADFASDIEGFLREAVLAGISAKVIEPEIQKLQDALADMMGDGILSSDERAKFQEMYLAIVKQSQEYMDIINEAGVDLTTSTNNANSLQGAFRSMTQESADIMSGQLGGMRLAQLETNQILKSGAAQQLSRMSKMIELQIDIEKNTRRTADNTEKIKDVNQNVEKVVEGQTKHYNALQAAGIIP